MVLLFFASVVVVAHLYGLRGYVYDVVTLLMLLAVWVYAKFRERKNGAQRNRKLEPPSKEIEVRPPADE